MKKALPLLLTACILMMASCSTVRRCHTQPKNYLVKIEQKAPLSFDYQVNTFLTPHSCIIYKEKHTWDGLVQRYRNSTSFVAEYPLSDRESEVADSLCRNLWALQDSIYRSPALDGQTDIITLKSGSDKRKITFDNYGNADLDRLYQLVNPYCQRAGIRIYSPSQE